MTALYNDNDEFVASWLESLITHGHIAPGRVDRRSIAELTPADVAGPGQRHFFAGIGGWSHALRLAGVPDDADVWTGSCPCQPFSDAGQGQGILDPRHLWPAWFALIQECRPPIIFGEQVASRDGLGWLDLVHADLERCGYAVGAADLCAAGVGAPHARQRLYFVAHTDRVPRGLFVRERQPRDADPQAGRCREDSELADADIERLEIQRKQQARGQRRRRADLRARRQGPEEHGQDSSVAHDPGKRRRQGRQTPSGDRAGPADNGAPLGMANPGRDHAGHSRAEATGERGQGSVHAAARRGADPLGNPDRHRAGEHAGVLRPHEGQHEEWQEDVNHPPHPPSATGGFWADAEWILCRDPSGGPPVARPVEPGTFPLASGVPGRVGLLRGYGNSIVPQVAAQFIMAALDAIGYRVRPD